MQQIYLEMLELSQDPNLNLYIAICAGISATLFLAASFIAIAKQFKSTNKKLAGGEISRDRQQVASFNALEESTATYSI
ncbi:hypothetical protein [Pseudanabaena sp. PCC 6802]|uniref:hypothetical protein n=1 Tax=Pseudanabaena sp. PCC 6802 TaxID=118173 RepID=UPI00034B8CDB|nr:hypothetical protein [Pseudanabaena sp. PCC 6802]